MSTANRATIAFTPDQFEQSKISVGKDLPPQDQSRSRDSFIRTEDRTEPQELQAGSLSRNAGMAPSRKGYFAPLMDALHETRRLQAVSVLHQYRHLIAGNHVCEAQDEVTDRAIPAGGLLDMANGDYSRAQRSTRSMALNRWILITAVVVFGILHVAGGIILFNASSTRPTETLIAAIRGD